MGQKHTKLDACDDLFSMLYRSSMGRLGTRLGRCTVRPRHLGRLGSAIVAGLDEELDLLALGQAAEAFGDDARLRPRTRCQWSCHSLKIAGGNAASSLGTV